MFERKICPVDFKGTPIQGIVGLNERVEIPAALVRIAVRIHALREARFCHFDRALYGEPAWDMLLAIYIAQGRGVSLSTAEVCEEAEAPKTTALRWIGHLEREGLVTKRPNPRRSNSFLVEITEKAALELNHYLARVSAIFSQE